MNKEDAVPVYSIKCQPAITKNEILWFASTWMDLAYNMISEIKQKNTKTIWFHLYVESKVTHDQI